MMGTRCIVVHCRYSNGMVTTDKTVDYRNKTSITGMKDADKDDDCRNEDMKR